MSYLHSPLGRANGVPVAFSLYTTNPDTLSNICASPKHGHISCSLFAMGKEVQHYAISSLRIEGVNIAEHRGKDCHNAKYHVYTTEA